MVWLIGAGPPSQRAAVTKVASWSLGLLLFFHSEVAINLFVLIFEVW